MVVVVVVVVVVLVVAVVVMSVTFVGQVTGRIREWN